jgi:hypothetical protein
MFGSAILLVSDVSFARPRGRVSSPPPKPAASQPAKPATSPVMTRASQPLKSGKPDPQNAAKAEPQKPFAAAPRPARSTFISINPRPMGVAPAGAAPAHGAFSDSAQGLGALQYNPDLGPVEEGSPSERSDPSNAAPVSEADAAVKRQVNERPKVAPGTTNLRMALPWTPVAADKTKPAPAAVVCYVQRSGACEPF